MLNLLTSHLLNSTVRVVVFCGIRNTSFVSDWLKKDKFSVIIYQSTALIGVFRHEGYKKENQPKLLSIFKKPLTVTNDLHEGLTFVAKSLP